MATQKLIQHIFIAENQSGMSLCTTRLDGTVPPWQKMSDKPGWSFMSGCHLTGEDENKFIGRTDMQILRLVHPDGDLMRIRWDGQKWVRL